MDQETVIQQFEILENKIEGLIEATNRLRNENEALKREKDLLMSELQEKADTEKRNDELKALVRSKIDNLMGRLTEYVED